MSPCQSALQKVKFFNRIEVSLYLQIEGRGEPWNLGDFAVVSHRILQTGLRNLAKFSVENCEPYIILASHFSNIVICLSWTRL